METAAGAIKAALQTDLPAAGNPARLGLQPHQTGPTQPHMSFVKNDSLYQNGKFTASPYFLLLNFFFLEKKR